MSTPSFDPARLRELEAKATPAPWECLPSRRLPNAAANAELLCVLRNSLGGMLEERERLLEQASRTPNELRAANDRLRFSNGRLNLRATQAEQKLREIRTVAEATIARLDKDGTPLPERHELRSLANP